LTLRPDLRVPLPQLVPQRVKGRQHIAVVLFAQGLDLPESARVQRSRALIAQAGNESGQPRLSFEGLHQMLERVHLPTFHVTCHVFGRKIVPLFALREPIIAGTARAVPTTCFCISGAISALHLFQRQNGATNAACLPFMMPFTMISTF
jgi:hypothetical protein